MFPARFAESLRLFPQRRQGVAWSITFWARTDEAGMNAATSPIIANKAAPRPKADTQTIRRAVSRLAFNAK
jgi:hypothetical protein